MAAAEDLRARARVAGAHFELVAVPRSDAHAWAIHDDLDRVPRRLGGDAGAPACSRAGIAIAARSRSTSTSPTARGNRSGRTIGRRWPSQVRRTPAGRCAPIATGYTSTSRRLRLIDQSGGIGVAVAIAAVRQHDQRPASFRRLNRVERAGNGVIERRGAPGVQPIDRGQRGLVIRRQRRDDRGLAADRRSPSPDPPVSARSMNARAALTSPCRAAWSRPAPMLKLRSRPMATRKRELAGGKCGDRLGRPSSRIAKSAAVRSVTGSPRRSVTVAYTSTRFTPDVNCA